MMVIILANRAWYDLRSTAHAHGLTFHTKQPKTEVYARLYRSLVQEGRLRRRFKQLTEEERSTLVALQVGGGTMPLSRFQKIYGVIRIYRPWRKDNTPKHPWKRPHSTAEKLWYLGFIEIVKGRPDQVMLPDEVMALLPPLPRPEPIQQVQMSAHPCETLCLDMAMLLGGLLYHDVRPLHGRWLPPFALRAINERLRIHEGLDGIRSELQTGRLRFLHYLAEAGGLVAVQAGYLKPTVEAWRWLSLPPDERWQALLDAVKADLAERHCLWDRYRLPSTDVQTWETLVKQLSQLVPGGIYPCEILLHSIHPYLPEINDLDALLHEPLTWLGVVSVRADTVTIMPRLFSAPQDARLMVHKDGIEAVLPNMPHLRPLTACCAWATIDHDRLRIDSAAVALALERGGDALQIASLLAELIGAPLPVEAFEQIEKWARAAQALTLHQVTLLTAHDPSALAALRSDWRLRPLLGDLLSSHHVAVPSGHAEELLAKLERRGCHVTSYLKSPTIPDDTLLSPEMVAYFWLAVRVYQKLGAFVSQDIFIPGAARDWLTNQLPPSSADGLEVQSEALIDRLAQTIRGKFTPPPIIQPENSNAVRTAVQSAYEQHGALTIEYFSPARGEKTVRTIEPVMLYDRNGAAYVEAWCRLDEDTRTFRVDRILRIIDET